MTAFIILGVLSALAARILCGVIENRRAGMMIAVLMPIAALLLYLWQGNPDIAPHTTSSGKTDMRLEVMRLAEKPFERLERTNGRDMGALAVMGDLNLKLGNANGAEVFYRRALDQADKQNDPRATLYRDKLKALE